ncbi:hypothetical protein BGZ80_001997 [Entomortierella chlamydospora]|uniref:Glucosidase 2 subunit beta n=1 Tax=Entomortierella chlamydospora TaxID=101097 RepID=A0A9P6N2J8_9FUNG|nr:hypothetical protein BGZ79_003774 [Entomortierella chlamydospora]KAG0021636.1 hypothetical protein BGZ80_001997 [Entomortierella chlamydospora]
MKANVLCIPLLVSIALNLVQANVPDNERPRGVAPSRAKLYTPDSTGNWKCLDGSKTISSKSINDDFCDCPDGSDEPGTSACGNTYFYCENIGHLPAYIRTSRLNDGVCDPECCDGTDEFDGLTHCPNVCQEVGTEARKERERVRKIEKEGSKIKSKYIAYGKGAKKRLREQLQNLKTKTAQIEEKTAKAQAVLDELNAKRQEYLESSKAEREAARKIQLEPFIQQQKQMLAKAIEIKSKFRSTLDDLKENYNKNYHDLAVKATITGFDEYLEELKQEEADAAAQESKEADQDLTAIKLLTLAQTQTYDVKKEIGRMFQLIKSMKEGYNTEYNDEAVLKAIKVLDDFAPSWKDDQNEFVDEDDIEVPEEVIETPQLADSGKGVFDSIYGSIRKAAKSVGIGFLFKEPKSELEQAQETHRKTSDEQKKLKDEIAGVERKLETDYGKDEAFAQLVDQCFEYKEAEYTYSLCLFGEAHQKSNSDISLGKFSSWVGDNHDTQMYTGGLRCWNGPERSVKVTMSCGAVNEIVAVSEPSKCEYLLKFRTPAACRIISDSEVPEDPNVIPEAIMPGTVPEGAEKKKHDEL